MKLSDVMSAATGLSSYAELSLVIFVGVFLGVALDLLGSKRRHDALGLMPLEREVEPAPATRREGRR
jgi:hypothetical protein